MYKEYSSYEQVYTTNDEGTFCGFIDINGNYSITPENFTNTHVTNGQKIWLTCETETGVDVKNGDYLNVGRKLTFTLNGMGGVLNDSDNPQIIWQVCNAEYTKDGRNHEIYYKGNEERTGKYQFVRRLEHVGTHLLKCEVLNPKKKICQQVVFVIHGVKKSYDTDIS